MKYIAKVDNLYKRYGNTVVFDGISLHILSVVGLLIGYIISKFKRIK